MASINAEIRQTARETTVQQIVTNTAGLLSDATGQQMVEKLEAIVNKFGSRTITILASADDGVEIVDQTIDIYNATTGILFGSVVYNSPTAVTIDVPDGFSYQIVPKCTLFAHYCTDKPTGIATSNVTVSLTFKTVGSLSTLPDLKAIADNGLGKYVPIGTEVSFDHSEWGNIKMEIVDFDSNEESFELVMKEVLRDNMQFDASEALLKAREEMPAGNYMFRNGSTPYYFTLTKPVAVNAQIRATTSQFQVYASPYDSVVSEQGTVSTTVLDGATDLGTCAQGMLNHMDRVNYGSNDYEESGIDQYLNSTGYDWWTAKTMFDRPPSYVARKGFLSGISQDVLDVIDDAEVKCVSQNTYCAPDSNHTKNQQYTLTRKFYLPSQSNIFGSADFADGTKIYNLYLDAENVDRIKYYGTSARSWWLRSPIPYAFFVRYVNTSGAVDNYYASNTDIGVAAACKISKSKNLNN